MLQAGNAEQPPTKSEMQQDEADRRFGPYSELQTRAPLSCESSSQQVPDTTRQLVGSERLIVGEIHKCFSEWHQPWRESFLEGGQKFGAIYELMEGLIHYENQILSSSCELSPERLSAIAKAVARLSDYGNAILDIDITIRSNDETFLELDPTAMTTIELYKAHIKAHKLRKKLVDNYFRMNKQYDNDNLIASNSPSSSLRVPHVAAWNLPPSPTMERSQRFSIGSNGSINTLGPSTGSSSSDGRRTPQLLSPSQIEVKTVSSTEDLTESQLEMRHMIATIRSKAFTHDEHSGTRYTLLLGVIAKVESLMTMPATMEKLNNCFELLDTLLDSIERLPVECRREEVRLIAGSLLKTLVRKVFIDERDSCLEFQHSHWTTYLLAIVRMMSASDYEAYLRTFSNQPDLSSFLRDYLFIIKRLFASRTSNTDSVVGLDVDKASDPIYPNCWIEMSLSVCQTFLMSLMCLFQVLRQHFGSQTQMWQSYLECLVHFLLQDVLKPGRRMLKERQMFLAADMRKTAAEYTWITWESLSSDQRYDILEDILEPMLRASMLLDSRERSILLPIFHDMMRCDYSCQYMSSRSTICNSGDVQSGRSMLAQLEQSHSAGLDEGQASIGNPDGLYLAPPTIYNEHENPDESLPYLSFRDSASSTNEFRSSSDDGTVLTKFTHLIIGKLHALMIDQDLGDEQFKAELCRAIAGELNAKYHLHGQQKSLGTMSASDLSQFSSMARQTSELVAEFIQTSLDLRQANRLSYNHLRLLCLFRLILFFRDKVDKIELYLANLHKLWRLHHAASRYVEAGFTLLEHAKSLPWTNKPLESHYRIMTRSFQSRLTDYTSLKLSLYTTIIEYFDQGQLWEAAVPLCRELIDVYQYRLFDYERLAHILARLSDFFGSISNVQLRSQPEYFRVSFYGIGFPQSLQNATVVYRGKPYEKLGDFCATLLSKYPDAALLKTLNQPDESLLLEPDAKYLQVNACTPMVDLQAKFGSAQHQATLPASRFPQTETAALDTNGLPEFLLAYYKHNECDKFQFSRKTNQPGCSSAAHHHSGDDFANMWRQRITLTTNSLPGMLPFFPVFLTEISTISPIECAIEDMERAKDRLVSMLNRFRADKHRAQDVRPLGQLLLGIVDAAVNGGITKYEEAFFGAGANIIKQPAPRVHHNSQQGRDNANKNHLTSETYASDHQSSAPPPSPFNDASKPTDGAAGPTVPPVCSEQAQTSNGTSAASTPAPSGSLASAELGASGAHASGQGGQIGYTGQPAQPSFSQLEKLKFLIAKQVPLLEEAIRLHSERVADVMRPQHDHLEASFKRLKNHVVSKYYRYLDKSDYNRSTNSVRSFRSFARSPNRSIRSESRIPFALTSTTTPNQDFGGGDRFERKRLSDVSGGGPAGGYHARAPPICSSTLRSDATSEPKPTDIPYKQLINERRSLPSLTGLQSLNLSEAASQQRAAQPLVSSHDETHSGLTPPPLPSRQGRNASQVALLQNQPPSESTSRQSGAPADDDLAYVRLSDVMQAMAIRDRKDANPYIQLSPDSDDSLTILSGDPSDKDKDKKQTLVTL